VTSPSRRGELEQRLSGTFVAQTERIVNTPKTPDQSLVRTGLDAPSLHRNPTSLSVSISEVHSESVHMTRRLPLTSGPEAARMRNKCGSISVSAQHRFPAVEGKEVMQHRHPQPPLQGESGTDVGSKPEGPIALLLRQLVERIGSEYGLTPREKQVLEGAALGRHTKAIASDLICSPKTIDEYWRRICRRFKLASRPAIVARLLWESLAAAHDRPQAQPMNDRTARSLRCRTLSQKQEDNPPEADHL